MPLRHHFPHTGHGAYLDHASTGPLSRPVMDALAAYYEQRHRTLPNNYLEVVPVVEATRDRLAVLVGADRERVDFAPNTSYALNVLAQGLDWRAGDRVAVPSCEFPANVYPWLGLEPQGVGVDFISHREGTLTVEDVEAALTPRTRVLAVSWVQFLSGFRCDLAALGTLCRSRGVLLAVDAIQGLGALRLDLRRTPVDFLACGGQKWLMAPLGTGFFYVSEALQDRLTPLRGWFNGPLDWDDFFAYPMGLHEDASRFRVGTLNHAGIVGLHAALGVYEEVGPAEAEASVLARSRQVAEGLARLGLRRYGSDDPAHASGIVTAEVPDPEDTLAALAEAGVHAAVRNGLLRLSPTWYNTPEEVDRALAVLEALAQSPRRTASTAAP
jgi:cysteine desulfurase / selenocysteine lyase